MMSFHAWIGRAKSALFAPRQKRPPSAGGGVADRKDFGWLIFGGSLLSFWAGWVNAFTLIATQITVSHVTGSTTKAGIALANDNDVYLALASGIW